MPGGSPNRVLQPSFTLGKHVANWPGHARSGAWVRLRAPYRSEYRRRLINCRPRAAGLALVTPQAVGRAAELFRALLLCRRRRTGLTGPGTHSWFDQE